MAFGDRIRNVLSNVGSGGGGGGWYLGKNVGMQPGQAAKILSAGGPGAIALQFFLRDRGEPEQEIVWAMNQGVPLVPRVPPPKKDYTPFYIGGAVLLAAILLMKK